MSLIAIAMFLVVCAVLLAGYPVALTLAGVALAFAGIGTLAGVFDPSFLQAVPNRVFGIMMNETLVAVPLFVLMGVVLERSRVAEQLLTGMASLFGRLRGGLAVSVVLVGALLAASTGIIGATVVTMGLLSLPVMLRAGYSPDTATGTICASGTLGQLIPPSIVLVLLGDVMSSAYQQAQIRQGVFSPDTVSVGDLFMGALLPGLLLVAAYIVWLLVQAWRRPDLMPAASAERFSLWAFLGGVLPPIALIGAVLGSIMMGIATPTEAASVGAVGAMLIALFRRRLGWADLRECAESTTRISAMVFLILIGASVFSLVFRGYGGDELVAEMLHGLPGGRITAVIVVMLVMFLLGFILDFIEITFVVVPIVGPILLAMGVDPVWLGVMMALNLQTSFLTPPFGFALFYLRGVAPDAVSTLSIYRGVIPFIVIQVVLMLMLAWWPALATWLPDVLD
ncbi:TRAP transporter large permease subunit [uncultured Abyssibacter sp.]|uniref:TRAP transporter large permease n=1 Tax=uncultured Abyssibacter sp. TaxID=2320202 RepID=UPI0032B18851